MQIDQLHLYSLEKQISNAFFLKYKIAFLFCLYAYGYGRNLLASRDLL